MALAVTVVLGCGSPEPASPAPEIVPDRPAREAEAPGGRPEDLTARAPEPVEPIVLGWPGVPAEPTEEARSTNAQALEDHARGDYAGSEAGFRAALEASPTYSSARFNLACALVRLGRLEEADVALRELLRTDLPALGARLEDDADLEALRSSALWSRLLDYRSAVRAEHARAVAAGLSVVRAPPDVTLGDDPDDAPVRRTIELGVWLREAARFVPIAPVSTHVVTPDDRRGGPDLLAAVLDRTRGVALVVEATGSYSEGAGYLDHVRATAYRPGEGAPLGRVESGRPLWWTPALVHATPAGLAVRHQRETPEGDLGVETRVAGDGGAFDADVRPLVVVEQPRVSVVLEPMPRPADLELEREVVSLRRDEETVPIPLDRAHAVRGEAWRHAWWAAAGDDVVWLLTAGLVDIEWGETEPRAVALSRIRRSTATAELVASRPAGIGGMARGGDGTLYVQLGDRLFVLPSADGAPEELPAGLVLSVQTPASYTAASLP